MILNDIFVALVRELFLSRTGMLAHIGARGIVDVPQSLSHTIHAELKTELLNLRPFFFFYLLLKLT